jgi:predicted adenine nucleotide alpha hydrolase (AANH) superfamily ATPase
VWDIFEKQAKAATDHNLTAFASVLANSPEGDPDPVAFVARAYQFWGKAALVAHFRETFRTRRRRMHQLKSRWDGRLPIHIPLHT